MISQSIKTAVLYGILLISVTTAYAQKQVYAGGSRFVHGFARIFTGSDYFYVDSLGHYAFDRIQAGENTLAWEANAGEHLSGAAEVPSLQYFYMVSSKNKVGILGSNGKWLLKPIYDLIDTHNQQEWVITKGAKKSLFNAGGFLLPFSFEDAINMDGHYFAVKQSGKWGIYDRQLAELTVPCLYEDIDYCYRCATKGTYAFAALHGKWGVIDFKNKVLLPFEYEHNHLNMRSDQWVDCLTKNGQPLTINLNTKQVTRGSNQVMTEDGTEYMTGGFVRIKKGDQYGMQNPAGKLILGFQYDFLSYSTDDLPRPMVLLQKGGHYGIADTNGIIMLQPAYDHDFTILDSGLIIAGKDGKKLLIDTKGKRSLPGAYENMEAWFPNEAYGGAVLIKLTEKGLYGFYNPASGGLTLPQYSDLYNYPDGEPDWIEVEKDRKRGVINRDGDIIVPLDFDNVMPMSNSHSLVQVTVGSNYGVYDMRKKSVVIPVRYSDISLIPNTHLFFVQQDAGIGEGLFDSAGTPICPVQAYQRLDETDTTGQFFVISRKDTVSSKMSYFILNVSTWQIDSLPYDTVYIGGYKDKLGVHVGKDQYALYDIIKKEIIKGEYSKDGFPEFVYPYLDKAFIVSKRKQGIMNVAGEMLIPAKYDLIHPLTGNLLMFVKKNGQGNAKYGFGDSTGKILIPLDYDYQSDDQNTYLQDSLLLLLKKDSAGRLRKGYAMLDGKTFIPAKYEDIIREASGKGYLIRNGDKFGIVGRNGALLLAPEFDNILLDEKSDYPSSIRFSLPIAARKEHVWRYYNQRGQPLDLQAKATINFEPPYEGNSEEKDAGELSASLIRHEDLRVADSSAPVSIGIATQEAVKADDQLEAVGGKGQSAEVISETADTAVMKISGPVDASVTADPVFITVENAPVFPGGNKELEKYIRKHTVIPAKAKAAGTRAKVIVSFIVDNTGKIKGVRALNDPGYGCKQEAVRVISSMPPWRPGRQNGRAVQVLKTWPVLFDTLQK